MKWLSAVGGGAEWKLTEARERHRSSIVGDRAPVRPRSTPNPDFLQNALKLGLGGKAHGSYVSKKGSHITW
jgi:hypothetical protein